MRHAFGLTGPSASTENIPFAIYSIPEVSYVGETEEKLKESGIDYVVGRGHYGMNPRGQIIGDTDGLLKLVFDAGTARLIGVHIVGHSASELVHIGQAYMKMQATAPEIAESLYNYPTLSDMYRHAALTAVSELAKRRRERRRLISSILPDGFRGGSLPASLSRGGRHGGHRAAPGQGSDFVWGWPLIILLFGTHLFLTFRLGFPQRHLWTAIKISFSREKEGAGDVSQFGALTTALAATIGTGNIVGVATAVAAGGPGAVLWMWLTGVFGIATKYSEALLSVRFRVKDANGTMAGGPMYVLERGMNAKWLGVIFAALTAVAAFGIGCMVQANSIASLAQETFGISPWVSGGLMTILTAVVILGGIQSIARVCELLVPFMAVFYILGCA